MRSIDFTSLISGTEIYFIIIIFFVLVVTSGFRFYSKRQYFNLCERSVEWDKLIKVRGPTRAWDQRPNGPVASPCRDDSFQGLGTTKMDAFFVFCFFFPKFKKK